MKFTILISAWWLRLNVSGFFSYSSLDSGEYASVNNGIWNQKLSCQEGKCSLDFSEKKEVTTPYHNRIYFVPLENFLRFWMYCHIFIETCRIVRFFGNGAINWHNWHRYMTVFFKIALFAVYKLLTITYKKLSSNANEIRDEKYTSEHACRICEVKNSLDYQVNVASHPCDFWWLKAWCRYFRTTD